MPIWSGRESSSGATTERNRPGLARPIQPCVADDTIEEANSPAEGAAEAPQPVGNSCPRDSATTLGGVQPGQTSGDELPRQLTSSKKYAMMVVADVDEPLTAVVITDEMAASSAAAATPLPSKSYLRRLGDYLQRRRLRSESQDGQEELSNVIYSDSGADHVLAAAEKKKAKNNKHGHFVMRDSTSDISDVDVDVIGIEIDEDEDEDDHNLMDAKAPKAANGYLLPRVFLNKEG